MTDGWKNTAGAHSIRFLVDFRVYKFRSFVSLDGSEHSVLARQSPYQLIIQQTYCGIKFLTRRKERKKEKRKTILLFQPRAVLNSGDPRASVKAALKNIW